MRSTDPRARRPGSVLLIHQLFALEDEAGGTRHVELSRRLVQQGHPVTVIASPISYLTGGRLPAPRGGTTAAGAGGAGLEVRRSWTYRPGGSGFAERVLSFLTFAASSAWDALRVPGVDVVWGTSPPLFQALGALAVARLRGCRFLLEVRDLWPDFAVELGALRNPVLIALARWTERLLYRQADAIVVNSPGFVPHLVARGAEADRITVIPNGVQVADFDPRADGEAFRRELGIGREIRLVVYTGAHGAPNDLDVLLDAAARLRGRRDVLIASIGGGRDKDRLIARAGEMGLENVRFVDARPKSRMPDVLAAADVCVAILKPIPLFDTTYPNKVFDYMAAGRPTVLAIDGVIREVVERAEGGTFVQPGDSEAMARAISSYVDDDALRKAHGRKARAYVEAHFRREEQAEALRALLEGVVAGRVG